MRTVWLFSFVLLLVVAGWARPVQSARGIATFEVPSNLQQSGGTSWGMHPNLVIECKEQFAPKGELKQLIWEMAPPTPSNKRVAEDDVEIDGAEGKVIAVKAGGNYARFLFVRRGPYNLGWKVQCMTASQEEVDTHFEQLRSSIRFHPDSASSGESEGSREVRDPSGLLEIRLPGKFAPRGANKYGNGQLLVILTPMRKADEDILKDFAFKYAPPGFKSYMRRNGVEMGDHKGALILATSDDGQVESQMVMLAKDGQAVVLTFMGPVGMRGQVSLLREQVAGQARWLR